MRDCFRVRGANVRCSTVRAAVADCSTAERTASASPEANRCARQDVAIGSPSAAGTVAPSARGATGAGAAKRHVDKKRRITILRSRQHPVPLAPASAPHPLHYTMESGSASISETGVALIADVTTRNAIGMRYHTDGRSIPLVGRLVSYVRATGSACSGVPMPPESLFGP